MKKIYILSSIILLFFISFNFYSLNSSNDNLYIINNKNSCKSYFSVQNKTDSLNNKNNLRYSNKVISYLNVPYKSAVTVIGQGEDLGKSIASGVIIRRKKGTTLLVLTNYHVVKDLDWNDIKIENYKKNKWKMRVRKIDDIKDIALMESELLEIENGDYVTISKDSPYLGSSLFVIGNPRSVLFNITKGILSNTIYSEKRKAKYYRSDAAIFFGNSGGGVYNNKGELIGLVMGTEIYPKIGFPPYIIPGGSIFVSRSEIIKFLKSEIR